MALSTRTLQVKKSSIPNAGLGLFARTSFRKGQTITEYKGRLQRWKDVKKEDGYNGYLLRVHRSWAINALPSKKTFGRYANDAAGLERVVGAKNNAEYVVYGLRCYIEATRDIQKGEEILVGYGREYWSLIRKLFGRR